MNIFEIIKPELVLSAKKYNSSLRKVKPIIVAGTLAIGLLAQPAHATLTFNFNYLNPGQGFQDSTQGAARQAALNNAASVLGAYFSNYTATLTYDVTSYSDKTTHTLASAGSGTYSMPGTFQQTLAQAKIIGNDNVASSTADGKINWNFGYDWGLGDTVTATQYDFKSTAMHELLHSFGFTSYIGIGGAGVSGTTPGTADTWTTYDNFLTDAAGNRLISPNGVFNSAEVAALTGGAGSVLFNGPNADAANAGAGIPIFSPSAWVEGSSISHLDDNSAVTSTSIMNANAHNLGLDTRTLGANELGILKDIGFTSVAAPINVPLPTAIWLMLGGLFGLLGLGRRKLVL